MQGGLEMRKRLRRTWTTAAVACGLLLFTTSCYTTAWFYAERVETSSNGEAPVVTVRKEHNGKALRIDGEGVTLYTNVHPAYTPRLVNPGVMMSFVVENHALAPLTLDEEDVRFSRFPPHQEPKPEGVAPASVTVDPASEQEGVWTIPPTETVKVHTVFRSPARAPGYMSLVLRNAESGERKAFSFKIKRD
jgi:hypothetical protein